MFQFTCKYRGEEKKVFIKSLNIYNGVSFEYDKEWDKDKYVLKLYYFKEFHDSDGYVTCERDYDSFSFDDERICLNIYNEIVKILSE